MWKTFALHIVLQFSNCQLPAKKAREQRERDYRLWQLGKWGEKRSVQICISLLHVLVLLLKIAKSFAKLQLAALENALEIWVAHCELQEISSETELKRTQSRETSHDPREPRLRDEPHLFFLVLLSHIRLHSGFVLGLLASNTIVSTISTWYMPKFGCF